MRKRLRSAAVLLVSAWFGLAASAFGQATRTWVSGVGDDANPCSRTAPCKTFAGAISKTAAGGVIDVLDPGGFGAVTITKAITIDGTSSRAGILVSGSNGVTVNAGASDVVVLRGLFIDGLGSSPSGVAFSAGARLRIEGCTITHFATGVDFEPAAGGRLAVLDTTISRSSTAAILVRGGSSPSVATLRDFRAFGNAQGVVARENSHVTAFDGTAVANGGAGFSTSPGTTAPTELALQDGIMFGNAFGALAEDAHAPGTATLRISKLMAIGNLVAPVGASGSGSIASFLDNRYLAGAVGSVVATAGTPQSAQVNTTFATALQATVSDVDGDPAGGVTVTFTAPASGPTGAFSGSLSVASTTNGAGVATAPTLAANTVAGAYTVTATVAGIPTPASFSLANAPGPAANIIASGGTPQQTQQLSPFAKLLQATVTDGFGNGVPGETVTFTAPPPGSVPSATFPGGVSSASVVTDSNGVAKSPRLTANGQVGPFQVTAALDGTSATTVFDLDNLVLIPALGLVGLAVLALLTAVAGAWPLGVARRT